MARERRRGVQLVLVLEARVAAVLAGLPGRAARAVRVQPPVLAGDARWGGGVRLEAVVLAAFKERGLSGRDEACGRGFGSLGAQIGGLFVTASLVWSGS